jgi:serine/threonine protein kinase
MVSSDEYKNIIRKHLKQNRFLSTWLGDVEIIAPLGEGGNAIVYSAKFGKNLIALKFLAEDSAKEQTDRYKRFVAEFRELIQLADTGLVTSIFALGYLAVDEQKFPYIAMKRYPFTLKGWMENNHSDEEIEKMIYGLLDCLELIHSRNIVHRDLKPENIFINDRNQPVLADFGIAWFDPVHYERLAHTTTGERLANFKFSAPEQFTKNPTPTPTMDLFALGQIIQWMITGDTHRGVGRNRFGDHFAEFDSVVDQLLQQDPSKRPETIDKVRKLIQGFQENSEDTWSDGRKYETLDEFSILLASMTPGKLGLIEIPHQRFEMFLDKFCEFLNQNRLWATRGWENFEINTAKRLDEHIWLLNSTECKIQGIWIYKSTRSPLHSFVLFDCAPMEPFFGSPNSTGQEYAAWFIDRYVSEDERWDGYAEIGGEIVDLKGKEEPRSRQTIRNFWFIGTEINSVVVSKFDDTVHQVYEELIRSQTISDETLAPLLTLRGNPYYI